MVEDRTVRHGLRPSCERGTCLVPSRRVASGWAARSLFVLLLVCPALLVPVAAPAAPDLSALGLSLEAEQDLTVRGFVVVPGEAADFPETYAGITERGIPSYITTDSAIYVTDLFLDRVLLTIVDEYLYERLETLSREMVRLSTDQYMLAADSPVKEAARRNVAYYGVGLSLLDPDYYPADFAISLVTRELEFIQGARRKAPSPIMGDAPLDGIAGPGEDYTYYVPRAHFQGSERLGRFYRAYTWYSRMAFVLPEGRVQDATPTLQALLTVMALESEAGDWLELWYRIEDPMSFYAGGADDPTPVDYMATADEIYGSGFTLEDLADLELLQEFVAAVGEYAPAHFETHQLRGMRFMSPSEYPDRSWFVRLPGKNDVAHRSALDMMALVGSRAGRTVLEERDRFGDPSFNRNFWEIERWFEPLTYGDWTEDLYWSWLYTITALVKGIPKGAPSFTSADQWDTRALSTGAAAWAIQRFPAARARGTGTYAPPIPVSETQPPYVEPYPDFYMRLRELLENLRDRLWEHYLLDEGRYAEFNEYCIFLTSLERISRQALKTEDLGGAGKGLGNHAATLAQLSAKTVGDAAGSKASAPPSIAFAGIAYRDFSTGTVLEVGIGKPDIIYVIVQEADGPKVYGGAVFSFYENEWADGSGLLYREWPQLIKDGSVARPRWVRAYMSE